MSRKAAKVIRRDGTFKLVNRNRNNNYHLCKASNAVGGIITIGNRITICMPDNCVGNYYEIILNKVNMDEME